ncbi:MAG: hypothetical protein IKZ19_08150 [Clostridia bacterium]|nr:hypothetical protein [Clostridia bacterium]
MKKKTLLGLILALCLSFSGCSVLDSSSLLALPEISPDQADLLQLVNSVTANSAWTVTAPVKGDELSSMHFVDFFSDGVKEAVCYFRNAAEMRIRVTVYSNTGGRGYTELCSFETEGYGVDSVTYTDFDCDGRLELALFVRYETGAIYGAEIYRLNNSAVQKIELGSCVAYSVCDLTRDGAADVVLARRGDAATADADGGSGDWAELFSWIYGVATKMGRVPILAGDGGSANITVGPLNEGMNGCIIDVCDSSGAEPVWMSNVLTWNGAFVNLSAEALGSASATARDSRLYCRDADFDGFLEIPMCYAMPSSGDQPGPDGEKYTLWYGFTEEYTLVQKSLTYCFPGGNWYYSMPELWNGLVYVKTGSMDGMTTVAFTADKNGRPNTLLTVYRVSGSDGPGLPEESFYISTAGGYSYYALVAEPDELDPLDPEIYVGGEEEVLHRFVTVDSFGRGSRVLAYIDDSEDIK